jgi:oligoribonuclease NrnB/cAMP/cGMP phosphodiesterase (DHH superfamily)
MDANLQKEFLRHGFLVSIGPDGGATAGAELVARYADAWKWDMAMYLRSLDVMVFDGKSNLLLASGSWRNSTVHGFYSSEKVVGKVVDDTLTKMSTP